MLFRSVTTEIPFHLELELDPRLTVISGLDDRAQAGLADVLEGVYRGVLEGVSGQIEVDGEVADLTAETLLRLELPAEVPARLRRQEVPSSEAEARQEGEDAKSLGHALTEARARLAAAAAHMAAAKRAREKTVDRRIEAERRLADLSAEIGEQQSVLEALVIPVDPGPVAAALASVTEAGAVADAPARAAQLLAALQGIDLELRATRDRSTAGWEQLAARELAEARAEVAQEQTKAGLLGFDPADVAALEQAHEKVGRAEERSGRHFGRGRRRRRLEGARNEERTLLTRMGLGSYADLLLMTAVPSFDMASKKRIDAASTAVDVIQRSIDQPEDTGEKARREGLVVQRTELCRQAAVVVGGQADDQDLVTRLEELAGMVIPDVQPLVDTLRSALAESTAEEPPPAPDDLAAAASAWLEVAQPAWDAYELSAEVRLQAIGRADALAQARSEAAGRLDLAVQEDTQAEEMLRAATEAVGEAELAVAEAERLDTEAAERVRSRARAREEAGGDPSSDDVASTLEVHVLARIAALRAVGAAGTLPIIVEDAFRYLPESARERGLDLLGRMSAIVQVIYLSNDPRVQQWAREGGRLVWIAGPAPS